VMPLISHRFPIQDAASAYELITRDEPSLGILLEYPLDRAAPAQRTVELEHRAAAREGGPALGFLGAGNYVSSVLAPAFARTRARLRTVVSANGLTGTHVGKKFGFELSTTDTGAVFGDSEIDAVVIATRHDTHARFVVDGLQAGKHVFVEKPLAIRPEEVVAIEGAYRGAVAGDGTGPVLMVGFNRRFAPHVVRIKSLVDTVRGPKSIVMTVNAGAVPAAHWTRDLESGGGRIVGEACHFIDVLRFLAGSAIVDYQVAAARTTDASVVISLRFSDGSVGTVHYLSSGHRSFPKERVEVFCSGRVLQLDNFRVLRGYGWPGFKSLKLWRQDKGQRACVEAFVSAIQEGKPSPIPFSELLEVARVTLAIAAAANA